MKKKLVSMLLAFAMVFALAAPTVSHAANNSQRETAHGVLRNMGYTEQQIKDGGGVDQSALQLGLVGGTESYIPSDPCYDGQYNEMLAKSDEIKAKGELPVLVADPSKPVDPEPEVVDPDGTPMIFNADGLATPIYNVKTDIERFCVYVETDYDTDGDGKRDLMKVLVQVPTAAVSGEYQTGVIFEARPYILGEGYKPAAGSYAVTDADLHREATVERPYNSTISSLQAAQDAKTAGYDASEYNNWDWYDYFLARGFAVVTAAGLGTKGSEGFQTMGSDLEIDAFASVVNWLGGGSRAFTDKENNIEINADWCNGSVGMTGRSYAGTIPFGVAGTGNSVLKTIVPVSGIASWYEYTNSQGYRMNKDTGYEAWLSSNCASRMKDANWDKSRYGSYLTSMTDAVKALNGNYGDFYGLRDYTAAPRINCSALIVHGMNDSNVHSKNFQMMFDAFDAVYADVKLVLHQDGHVTPAHVALNRAETAAESRTEMFVDGKPYHEMLNRWFSHYLFDIPNGAENMAAVTAQDNYDGSWHRYNTYDAAMGLTMNSDTLAVNDRTVILGTIPVSVNATPADASENNLLHVQLVDTCADPFNAFPTSDGFVGTNHQGTGETFIVGGGAADYDVIKLKGSQMREKVITEGWMDLANPSAGFKSSTAVKETISGGTAYDYTVYLNATHYVVDPGHTLKLVVTAANGTVNSFSAQIPVSDPTASIDAFAVNYSAEANGSVFSNRSSGDMIDDNCAVTLLAAPEEGYEFDGWMVNGQMVPGGDSKQFTITEETEIVAQFKKADKPVDPEVDPDKPVDPDVDPDVKPEPDPDVKPDVKPEPSRPSLGQIIQGCFDWLEEHIRIPDWMRPGHGSHGHGGKWW